MKVAPNKNVVTKTFSYYLNKPFKTKAKQEKK